MIVHEKPKLSVLEQIEHLKGLGVHFERCPEDEAARILARKNNYFRLASFRTLFDRYADGPREGKFIDLDFGDLVLISYFDQSLRSNVRSLSIDVEHYKKVELINRVTDDQTEDGYGIVTDFLEWLPDRTRQRLFGDLDHRKQDTYAGALIKKYWAATRDAMPVWVLFEVISFGTFVNFCRFCAGRWKDSKLEGEYYRLLRARDARNAAAHGACIVNGFADRSPKGRKAANSIKSKLGRDRRTSSDWRSFVCNGPILDIVTLIDLYTDVVPDGESRRTSVRRLDELEEDLERLSVTLGRGNRAIECMDFIFRARDVFGLV